jgi:hypothetical protein
MTSVFEKQKPTQPARDYLAEVWLDWHNNYLSAEVFAEHNGITPEQARKLLAVARSVFDSKHPDA